MVSRFVTVALLLCALSVAADVVVGPGPRLHQRLEAKVAQASPGPSPFSGTSPICVNAANQTINCAVDLQYFGGPVLSNVKVYAVFWTSQVSSDIQQGIGDFYGMLTTSQWVDWLTEYSTTIDVQAGSLLGQPGTQQVIGRGVFAGSYLLPVLSMAYPACASPDDFLTCVSDVQVQNELGFQIRHGYLPAPDANTLYMVHFPYDVRIQLGSANSCQAFCSYHSAYRAAYGDAGTQDVFYGVIPDVGSNGCENGCGVGTTFQNTSMVTSHEIAESITDSAVGLAGPIDFPLGWYDTEHTSQGEAADMCNQHSDVLDGTGVPGCTGGNSGCYTVQQVFSHVVWNANPGTHPNTPACVTTRFDVNDYALAVVPNTLTLAPGATAPAIPITTTVSNGSPQPLTLSVTSVPAGLHASLDNFAVDAGDTAHLTLSADSDAVPFRDGLVVLRAAGATTHSAALLVQLAPAVNDWSLFLTPASGVLSAGTTQVYYLGGRVTYGDEEAVTVLPTVSGLPPGVTVTFLNNFLNPGESDVTLELTAAADAPGALPTTFTVTGTSASQPVGHSATAVVQVNTPPSVAIVSPSAGATVSGVVNLQLAVAPGTNAAISSINLAVDNGAPLSNGTTGSSIPWDSNRVVDGSHTLLVTVLDTDGFSASASLAITVANHVNDFSLSVSQLSVDISAGTSRQFSVTTTVATGTAESITLQLKGLPTGITATFDPPSVTAGGTSQVILLASNAVGPTSAAGDNTVITLSGTTPSVPLGHSVDISLTYRNSSSSSSGGGCTAAGASDTSFWPLLLLAGASLARRRKPPAPFL
jgi:uncharacterized protein (TIGR03382 family)